MESIAATYKIVVLGEGKFVFHVFCYLRGKILIILNIARVGKTSCTVRFCKNKFDDGQKSTLDATCLE